MSAHLSPVILNALADGELSGEQLVLVHEHLAGCPRCTSNALAQSLLKSATARAGHRYAPPRELRARLARLASRPPASTSGTVRPAWGIGRYHWATAAAMLLVCVGILFVQRSAQRASYESANLVTEVCDQHIATLAANSPPEVISSDRHTVKPWFQGKIAFSFNLPDNLAGDTALDGANLTYLQNQPTAQLLYSIAKHHVSVFIQQRTSSTGSTRLLGEHSGFHVTGFQTADLEVIAVGDVEPTRLADLIERIKQAQTRDQGQRK